MVDRHKQANSSSRSGNCKVISIVLSFSLQQIDLLTLPGEGHVMQRATNGYYLQLLNCVCGGWLEWLLFIRLIEMDLPR